MGSHSALIQAPEEVRWSSGADAQGAWAAVGQLLLGRHAWLRGVAGRLMGLAFADPNIGEDIPAILWLGHGGKSFEESSALLGL